MIKEFFYSLILSVASLQGVYLVIDFFEKIDNIIKYSISPLVLLKYIFFSLPQVFFLLLPVAMLIAVLLTLGIMSRNNELLALKAGGISLYRASLPLLIIALVFSGLSFFCNEMLLPKSNQLANYYRKIIEGEKVIQSSGRDQIWFWGGENDIINVQLADLERKEVWGIKLFQLSPHFQLIRRIDAERGFSRDGVWYLYNGVERVFNQDEQLKGNQFRKFQQEAISLPVRFKDIFLLQKQPQEMCYQELSKYIKRLPGMGYMVEKYKVDLYSKISIPFIIFVMTLVGVSFSIKIEKSARLLNIGMGVFISFLYWVVFYLSISMGHAGLSPPILSAWFGNIIFLTLGGYLFYRMPT